MSLNKLTSCPVWLFVRRDGPTVGWTCFSVGSTSFIPGPFTRTRPMGTLFVTNMNDGADDWVKDLSVGIYIWVYNDEDAPELGNLEYVGQVWPLGQSRQWVSVTMSVRRHTATHPADSDLPEPPLHTSDAFQSAVDATQDTVTRTHPNSLSALTEVSSASICSIFWSI